MSTAPREVRQPPFMATAVFCEDVRPEPTGATTLVGVFPDTIAVPALPAMMRKLSIQVRTVLPLPVRIKSHVVEVHMPGIATPVATAAMDQAGIADLARVDPKGRHIMTILSHIQAENAPIPGLGTATVEVIVDGHRVIAGILNIKVQNAG